MPVGDTAAGEVVGRHLDLYRITLQNAYAKLPHLAAKCGENIVTAVDGYAKCGIGKNFRDCPLQLDGFLLGHALAFLAIAAGVSPASRGRLALAGFTRLYVETLLSEIGEEPRADHLSLELLEGPVQPIAFFDNNVGHSLSHHR